MAVNLNDADEMSAPANYADLYEQYYAYVVNLCTKFGIDDNNKEDAACEIFLRFMERGSLEKFDPTLVFEYRGEARPARFKSYLYRAVDMYTRGIRDRQTKLRYRELQINDSPTTGRGLQVSEQDLFRPTSSLNASWVDGHRRFAQQDHADGVQDMLDEDAEAATVRALLAQVPARNSHDQCDLAALYDAVRAQVLAYGEYDINLLKDHFGVSSTAMHTWMWWLKDNLAQIYGRQLPPKRRRTTKPKAPLLTETTAQPGPDER